MDKAAVQNALQHLERQNAIALSHMHSGQTALAVELLKAAMNDLGSLPDEEGAQRAKIAIVGNLGQAYQQLSNTNRAIPLLQTQLELAGKLSDSQAQSHALNGLGICYFQQGELDKATDYFQKRIRISEQIGDDKGLGNTLNNLANVYRTRKQYGEARALLERRIAIARRIGDKRGEASSLSNLAELCIELNQTTAAARTLRNAVAVMEQSGNPRADQARARLAEIETTERNWRVERDGVRWSCSLAPEGIIVLTGQSGERQLTVMTHMADRDEFLGGKLQQQLLELMGQQVLDEIIQAVSDTEEAAVEEPKVPDPFDGALKFVLADFVDEEYAKCIDRILAVLNHGLSHEYAQLLLISAERAGRDDVLRDYAGPILAAFADQAWYYELLTATVKKRKPRKLAGRVLTAVESCQMHFYTGLALEREGKTGAAKTEFNACVDTGAMCIESGLAHVKLKRF
jgi:tetratricopeptide (TPR) repeat protein